MTTVVQSFDITISTDSNGKADVPFTDPVDQVLACAYSPQVNDETGTALVSVTAQLVGQTPTRTARIRVWAKDSAGGNTVVAAANRTVRVTLLGVTH